MTIFSLQSLVEKLCIKVKYSLWGSAVDFSSDFLVDGTWNPCKISYLVKIKPNFSPKKDKKLIFPLNRSFLNCSNSSKNKNHLHKQFCLKVTLNTNINFTPKVTPKLDSQSHLLHITEAWSPKTIRSEMFFNFKGGCQLSFLIWKKVSGNLVT